MLADGGEAVSGGALDVSSAEGSEGSDDRYVPGSDAGSFCSDHDGDMQHGDDGVAQGVSLGSEAGASTASWQAAGLADVLPDSEADGGGEGVTVGRDGGGGGGVAGMRKLAEAVHAERRLPAAEQSSVEHWEALMRAAFAPPVKFTHAEQETGSHDWAGDARGARVFAVVDESRVPTVFGGATRFGLRGTAEWDVVGEWRLGDDGFREGWQERAAALRQSVSFDEEGFPLSAISGGPMGEAELGALPPFSQLVCRARVEIGAVKVFASSPGKLPLTHVSMDVMEQNWIEACAWQARLDLTAAYATDAGTGSQKNAEGRTMFDAAGDPLLVVSQAAVRHDGAVRSGVIDPKHGLDNYVGELGALLQALEDAEAGGRIALVFDATSPVRAWLKFRGRHARHKLNYYARMLLDTFEQLVQKCEVVVLVWQTSHVGSPANEWADLAATAALARAVLAFPVRPATFFTYYYTRAERSLFRWALCRGRRAVFGRMSASLSATVFLEAGDIPLGGMVREAEDICRAVRSRTCLLSDRLQRLAKPAASIVRAAGCMCGCKWADSGEFVLPTWSHCMFWCEAPAFVVRREEVRNALQEVELGDVFNGQAMGGTHRQLGGLLQLLSSTGRVDFDMSNDEARLLEGEMRRVFGKCVLGSGSKGVDRQRSVKRALRRLVLAGCDLLQTAQVWEAETLLLVVELNCRGYLQRLCFKPWKAQWSASGPARVAALAELRRGREAVQRAAAAAVARGTMSNLGRFIAGVRVVREARKERALIELRLPGHDPRVAALWCIAAAVRVARWRRLRAREAYERSRGWARLTTARPARRAPVVVQLWRVALPGFALPARSAVAAACSSLEGVVVPGAFKSAAAAVGRCLRYGLTSFDPLARSRFSGRKLLVALRAKVGESEAARLLVAMQARMLKWCRRGGHGTLSGRPKEPLGVLHSLEFKPRWRGREGAAAAKRNRSFRKGAAADSNQRWAVEGVLEARRSGGIWGLVRWVSQKVDGAEGWDDSWVRLLHMSAELRRETRSLLGTRPRLVAVAPSPPARVGERRSERVAALAAAAIVGEGDGGHVSAAGSAAESSDGEGSGSGGACDEATTQGQAAVEEVLQWKRSRGKLWGLVRWEPDAVLGEHPVEWKEERALGSYWVAIGRAAVQGSTRRRTRAVGGGAPSDRSSAAAARRSEQDVAAAKVVAQALAERKARDRRAVERSARVAIAGDKRGATSAGGGEGCRPRTRASQGVGVGGVKRGCGAGSPSGGAIAARASEEEEARVSRTARAAGPKRRLWRDVV